MTARSLGHIGFTVDWHQPREYFQLGEDVYIAYARDEVQQNGRRFGRWECPRTHFDRYKALGAFPRLDTDQAAQ